MQNQSSHTQNIQAPLVSFIITTYNMPTEYLEECLKSILQLSLNAKEEKSSSWMMEAISVQSTDSRNICRISSICVSLTREPAWLRNYGMMIAKGRFIQFVDGDDYLVQTAYEHCSRHRKISSARHRDFQLCKKQADGYSSL